ncbi:hypothetical protein HYT92_00930, partial [Candidatus Pacearchaeota archaeon]|nr:hypothetical protein [Candidatus Pacearchaeota archaeon]
EVTARTLTSSDGKKSITIKPDGTTELEERVSKGKVKTLITKTSEGVTTQTTCKDATGCAKDDATGQLQGQYDSIKLNTANREVLETSSRLKSAKGQAIDEIVQSGWTLGAPDKEGYRAIEGEGIQKDTGHDVKYYKNGKIYIKDAKGKYQESPFEGDNKVEKKFQEELQKSKAEDYQEVTVKYGNPPDFRKSPYITEIKVGTDSWNLGEPDDERYQEISGFRLSENTNADGKSISAYTGKKYYKDGEIYIRDANGKYVRSPFVSDKEIEKQFEEAKVEGQLDKANDLKNELYEEERKEASREKYRKFFANVERVFTQFRGLRYYATLFMDDKDLMRWRQDVDEAFSKLYLGSEYWISEICEKDIEGKSEGVAYAETPQGLAQIAAHIEATRTQPILNLSDETAYIYKITFNVRNGDYKEDMRAPENMTFNAIIVRESESLSSSLSSNNFVPLFKRNIHLGRGEAFGRMGSTAIVKETKNSYSAVCLIFKEIPLKWKLDENKKISITWTADDGSQKYAGTWWTLCNTIPTSSGEPAALPRQGAAAPQGSDAELNDF